MIDYREIIRLKSEKVVSLCKRKQKSRKAETKSGCLSRKGKKSEKRFSA